MKYLLSIIVANSLFIGDACSPNDVINTAVWRPYSEAHVRGFSLKPNEVKLEGKWVYFNEERYSVGEALHLIILSRDMIPTPPVLIIINSINKDAAVSFSEDIEKSGFCNDAGCYYKIVTETSRQALSSD